MSATFGWLRRQLAGVVAVVLVAGMFVVGRGGFPSAAEAEVMASGFGFAPMSVAMPSGFAQQEIRRVNRDYQHIDAW
ncbi:MAG TPA: RNA-binding protein, partial [Actinophytocola sp.]|nr:RNA-binding protein [Actinophytocola sp.]